jgi:hypothetical protein
LSRLNDERRWPTGGLSWPEAVWAEDARMARRRRIRSEMYRTARITGDVEAAQKRPTAYGKRVMRKSMYRRSNSLTRRLLRMVGLSR